jgi:hypothetical protein
MRLAKILSVFLLALLAHTPFAADIKVPMDKVCEGELCFFEYTSSAANGVALITADTLTAYDDTSGNVAVNPDYLLNKVYIGDRASIRSYAGAKYPEKMCVAVFAHGGGDASTMRLESWWGGSTSTDTLFAASTDTVSFDLATVRKNHYRAEFDFLPKRFFAPKFRVTSATDTAFVKSIRIFPCDN